MAYFFQIKNIINIRNTTILRVVLLLQIYDESYREGGGVII